MQDYWSFLYQVLGWIALVGGVPMLIIGGIGASFGWLIAANNDESGGQKPVPAESQESTTDTKSAEVVTETKKITKSDKEWLREAVQTTVIGLGFAVIGSVLTYWGWYASQANVWFDWLIH